MSPERTPGEPEPGALRFGELIEGFADPLVAVDADGRIRYANAATSAVLGHGPAGVIARPLSSLLHPSESQALLVRLHDVLAGGSTAVLEHRILRGDGHWELVETLPNRLVDPAGRSSLLLHVRSIARRREAEEALRASEREQRALAEQLHQAQKLESIGRLAGGVAHDFNNLLTVMLACGTELRAAVPRVDPDLVEACDDLLGAARRGTELTQQLLAFARKHPGAPVRTDLTEVVRQTERLVGRVIGEDVQVREALTDAPWPVRCDPGLMSQVLMNLAVNARDAMPQGGTLTLSTENVVLGPEAAAERAVAPGRYVRLGVEDDGKGMSAEVLQHVFEPFFTTKAPGAGTGLGLATVYGIVKQSGGHVNVRSAPGAGTRFELLFPAAEAAAAPAPPEEGPMPGGTERVLLVEDDEAIRKIAARVLRRAGYDLAVADGGEAAIELLRLGPPFDLVVTDVVMPGVGGRELALFAEALGPRPRVLFMSGFPDAAATRLGPLADELHLLAKPFSGSALLTRVRAVLGGPRPSATGTASPAAAGSPGPSRS
ncbi:MAG: ATP-binding protein [Anaeromyxobacteraceae bacterium]